MCVLQKMGNTQYTIEIYTIDHSSKKIGNLKLVKSQTGFDGYQTLDDCLHRMGFSDRHITMGFQPVKRLDTIAHIYNENNHGTKNNYVLKLLTDSLTVDCVQPLMVNLLSWNVYLKPSVLGNSKPRMRASIMAEKMEMYDILCFQEAFRALPLVGNALMNLESVNREEFLRKKLKNKKKLLTKNGHTENSYRFFDYQIQSLYKHFLSLPPC